VAKITAAQVPEGHRVRLVDVSALAGVTKSVASRVLNQDPTLNVRPETRQRIMNAATELGYRPHAGARALAGAETRSLALLIPDLSNPVYSRIIRGAYRRARERGYLMLLAEDTVEDAADESFAQLVETGRVDGLLIASARPDHTLLSSPRLAKVPHVFVNRVMPGSSRNVDMDMAAASSVAVAHLYDHGHTKIGLVSGPKDLEPARTRERGFAEKMRELDLDGSVIARETLTEHGGALATAELLTQNPELTAIFASTLSQAVGALHAIRTMGMRIPEDVSVLGYDDLPLADYLDPPLTTIAMPLAQLGAAAVDAVVSQILGEPPSDLTIGTSAKVIQRRSVSSPSPRHVPQGSLATDRRTDKILSKPVRVQVTGGTGAAAS
jgi:LacI family transcriptional regulator